MTLADDLDHFGGRATPVRYPGLDDFVGRSVRVRCGACGIVLGALESNGGHFGLGVADAIERTPRVLAATEFHARPSRAHVVQRVYEHPNGLVSVTWYHRCEEHRRRPISLTRRLDRIVLGWVNAARAGVDLRLEV